MARIQPSRNQDLASPRLQELLQNAVSRDRAAANENTRRTYADGWQAFEEFCDEEGLSALPADPHVVVAFMEHLAVSGYAYNTIESRLTAIGAVHHQQKLENPCNSDPVRRQRKNLRRTMDTTGDGKKPLLLKHIDQILEVIDDTSLQGVRDRALLLVGFAGAFRRSELRSINVGDIETVKGGKIIRLRQSKTDQDGEGIIKQIPDKVSFDSPNKALDLWLEAGKIYSGAVFRMVDRWENVRDTRLTGRAILDVVQKYVQKIGLDPAAYGAHSLRSGFLTQGYLNGVGEHELAQVSNHESLETLRGYQRVSVVMDDHPLTRMTS